MSSDRPTKHMRLTFTGGGWVLVLTGLICLTLVTWAVAPALIRHANRPPGDGTNIESYGFDLSNLSVPRDLVVPAMIHRDMAPALMNPTASSADVAKDNRWETMQKANDPKYGKYLVPSDLVIGVIVNGEARAYPIQNMYVHEIVNDTLGGVPIAVTYHWPCDSVAVFDRRVAENILTFRVSGLVYNSNLLMFDEGSESLWSQLLAHAVSGPLADHHLQRINAQLQRWEDWSQLHPNTTVLNRELHLSQRYKKATPTSYLQHDELLFPVRPLPDTDVAPLKARSILFFDDSQQQIVRMPDLIEMAKRESPENSPSPTANIQFQSQLIRCVFDRAFQTVRIEIPPAESAVHYVQAYWFASHAFSESSKRSE
jgi:hypothetical protein